MLNCIYALAAVTPNTPELLSAEARSLGITSHMIAEHFFHQVGVPLNLNSRTTVVCEPTSPLYPTATPVAAAMEVVVVGIVLLLLTFLFRSSVVVSVNDPAPRAVRQDHDEFEGQVRKSSVDTSDMPRLNFKL